MLDIINTATKIMTLNSFQFFLLKSGIHLKTVIRGVVHNLYQLNEDLLIHDM